MPDSVHEFDAWLQIKMPMSEGLGCSCGELQALIKQRIAAPLTYLGVWREVLLEVQHRGDSCIIDRWRSRPHADGVRLPLSHSRKMDEQSSNKHGAAPRSVVRWV